MITSQDKQHAVLASLAAGFTEMAEGTVEAGGYVHTKLGEARKRFLAAASYYKAIGFAEDDLAKATEIFDQAEAMVKKTFGKSRIHEDAVCISIAAALAHEVHAQGKIGDYGYGKLSSAFEYLKKATDTYAGKKYQGPAIRRAARVSERAVDLVSTAFAPPRVRRPSAGRMRGRDGRFIAA
jgi:hypothetical protein